MGAGQYGTGSTPGNAGTGGTVLYLKNIPLSIWGSTMQVALQNGQTTMAIDSEGNQLVAYNGVSNDKGMNDFYSVASKYSSYFVNAGYSTGGTNESGYSDTAYGGGGAGSQACANSYYINSYAGDGYYGHKGMNNGSGEIVSKEGKRANYTVIPVRSIFDGTGAGGRGVTNQSNLSSGSSGSGGGAGAYGDGGSNSAGGYGAGGSGNTRSGIAYAGGNDIVVIYYHSDPI